MAVTYAAVYSDIAASDLDRLNLFYIGRDPAYAARWNAGILAALEDLTAFPGPLSHARDEEASVFYGREVRRLLYYGATRRRKATPVRALFTLLPPSEEDPDAETVIFLLRLLHGPQSLIVTEETP